MLNGQKISVVLPAYNAELTLRRTVDELDRTLVDHILVVDDFSSDGTVEVAKRIGLPVVRHDRNRGYGANQKTCYREAIAWGADIIIMVHPDYQYSPKLVPAVAAMIAYDEYDMVLASRILGGTALRGGMPIYKYAANRVLTLFENVLTGLKLSEYHTGFRGFRRNVLESIRLEEDSDDFVFDNQVIAQVLFGGFRIGELSCPTKYTRESSSINFKRSVKYGIGVIGTSIDCGLARANLARAKYLVPADTLWDDHGSARKEML